jgi:AcrR family transcriptional regulator
VGPEALIRAARELLQRLPPAKVTRAEVARHAGVDPALIRYYFRDRESLLLAVGQQIVGEHLQRVRTRDRHGARALARADPGLLHRQCRFAFFHRVLIEEIARAASKPARAAFYELDQFAIGRYAEILRDGEREHGPRPPTRAESLRAVDPALLHIAVGGMLSSSWRRACCSRTHSASRPSPRVTPSAELIADLVIDGIQCR